MMHRAFDVLCRFKAADEGATAIEYSLIAAAVFLGIVPLIKAMEGNMHETYQRILSYFDSI